ncbi:MAG: acyl-CoA dehydrogenase family protein, partial [Gammaproteobacteria bacterium]|nr:acyl-CoA dehydrogenase family protein [Gammaproteobacteria bacterium]
MINFELPKSLKNLQNMTHQLAEQGFRPISRKYDRIEHGDTPAELKPLAQMIAAGRPRGGGKSDKADADPEAVKNGSNLMGIVSVEEMCWGDTGLMLSLPASGLGNAAIQAVGTAEQKEQYGKLYCAMAITEPGAGSDSAAISTTARRDGDEWVLNGEKIYCTGGQRCDAVVVWATLDKSLGKAAIKSFIVPRDNPGMQLARVEDKMGLRISDTAALSFTECRIPLDHVLGSAEIADTEAARKKAFGGVMQTFDNTRPMVAAMALGVARAALEITTEILEKEGVKADFSKTPYNSSAIELELYRL